jgi:hypothetical protein
MKATVHSQAFHSKLTRICQKRCILARVVHRTLSEKTHIPGLSERHPTEAFLVPEITGSDEDRPVRFRIVGQIFSP